MTRGFDESILSLFKRLSKKEIKVEMPRVFTVTKNKGGKEYKCSSCSKVIQAGEKYHYFTRYRASSKTIRCIDHYPKPSELTGSETLQIAYSVQESLDAIGYEYDDVISTLEDAYSEIEGLVDTLSDKVSNVEEAFPNGTPVLDQLQEYLENAESFRDSIEEGLNSPQSIRFNVDEYRKESNPVNDFINDCCEIGTGDDYQVETVVLYRAYIAWCKEFSKRAMGRNNFYNKMYAAGFEKHKTTVMRNNYFLGIKLEDKVGNLRYFENTTWD